MWLPVGVINDEWMNEWMNYAVLIVGLSRMLGESMCERAPIAYPCGYAEGARVRARSHFLVTLPRRTRSRRPVTVIYCTSNSVRRQGPYTVQHKTSSCLLLLKVITRCRSRMLVFMHLLLLLKWSLQAFCEVMGEWKYMNIYSTEV